MEILKTAPHLSPGGIYPNEKLIREFLSYDMLFPLLSSISDGGLISPQHAGFIHVNKVSTGHWSRQYELPWAIDSATISPTDIVLDAGCGYSSLKFVLSKRCKKVYGIDLDIDSLRQARSMCEELKLDNVELLYADIATFKSDLLFDKIYCISVIEHGADEQTIKDCVKNMKSLLKPGGKLILTMDLALQQKIDQFNVDIKLAMELLGLLDFTFDEIDKIHEIQGSRVANFEDKFGQSATMCVVCCVYTKPLSRNNSWNLSP